MFSSDDENQGLVLGVVFGVIALVIALVIGIGIYTRNLAAAPKAAPAAAQTVSVVVVQPVATVKVENGVVKFYFVVGKADVAPEAAQALVEVVKAVAAGKLAVISGYHDASGDPAQNAELAKQRALAVRAVLVAQGVAEDKVELRKPEQTLASGPAEEARRVEVTLK
ncbi:MAG: OmpA family protein [Burkholderiaceae bacterium]|jgi:outer membrane protein OmpA-like peptidoglycan-associated protein